MHTFITAYGQAQEGYLRLEREHSALVNEREAIEARHKAEIEDKDAALAAKDDLIAALNKSREEIEAAVIAQRDELRAARTEAAQLRREKDVLAQEKANLEQERSLAQADATSLRESLAEAVGRVKQLSSDLAAAKDAARSEIVENLEDLPEFQAKVWEGIQDTSFPVLNEILDALLSSLPVTDAAAVRALPHVGGVFHFRDSEYTSIEEYLDALRAGAFDGDDEEGDEEDDEAGDLEESGLEKEAGEDDALGSPVDSGKCPRPISPDVDNIFKGLADLPEGPSSGAGGHSQELPDATQKGTPEAFQSDLADPTLNAPVDPNQPPTRDPSLDPSSTSLPSGPTAPASDSESFPVDQSVPSPTGQTAPPSTDQTAPPPAVQPTSSPVIPAANASDASDPCAGIPDLSAPRKKPAQ